jgi:hypothetical protein
MNKSKESNSKSSYLLIPMISLMGFLFSDLISSLIWNLKLIKSINNYLLIIKMSHLKKFNFKMNIRPKKNKKYKNRNLQSSKDLGKYLKWLDHCGIKDFKFHRKICKIKKFLILIIPLIININLLMKRTLFSTIVENQILKFKIIKFIKITKKKIHVSILLIFW